MICRVSNIAHFDCWHLIPLKIVNSKLSKPTVQRITFNHQGRHAANHCLQMKSLRLVQHLPLRQAVAWVLSAPCRRSSPCRLKFLSPFRVRLTNRGRPFWPRWRHVVWKPGKSFKPGRRRMRLGRPILCRIWRVLGSMMKPGRRSRCETTSVKRRSGPPWACSDFLTNYWVYTVFCPSHAHLIPFECWKSGKMMIHFHVLCVMRHSTYRFLRQAVYLEWGQVGARKVFKQLMISNDTHLLTAMQRSKRRTAVATGQVVFLLGNWQVNHECPL